jgi:hypothetical protein
MQSRRPPTVSILDPLIARNASTSADDDAAHRQHSRAVRGARSW